ncbi:phosphonate metabolism protein PhnP [Marinobacterium sp. AK62]|uniref:Phosphonate metabolism protein PhnP n=1 Tax=Marinobacterium alkalitolerans TaxID=1542925 RepID=A0ABS3Z7D3_9GAMM|nr:phosphonate metabolism protein PhnP [Marinobacterium alkalitolerans]MBP0047615.1 phosphonate metabolism protein PhnP [Marinobacterium alkalitolerans]
MLEFQLTGTGNAGGVPLWGCDCPACSVARRDPSKRRQSASAVIRTNEGVTLLDAGITDLAEHFRFEEVVRVLLTHFHMDHVQGLFPLRWAESERKIPVYRPDDPEGADDLYKHPGVFQFLPSCEHFRELDFGAFAVTPLPLIHSRATQGFLIRQGHWRLAYLTDTVGLPEQTLEYLQANPLDELVLDCSEPPCDTPPRNHNDLNSALSTWRETGARRLWLTHISHRLDTWLQQGAALPEGVFVARDGLSLSPDHGA